MKKWLFNPFIYVAGGKALGLGALAMATAAIAAYATSTHFDGVLHMTPAGNKPLWTFAAEQLVCWLSLSLMLFIAAAVFSTSKVRVIDVAGTQALARWPSILVAILGAGIRIPNTMDPDVLSKSITLTTVICAILSLTFIVWMVALFYNAFKVSANIKGGKGVAVFVVSLLVADLLSRIILSQLYKIA